MRNRLSTGARIAACVVGVMIASQTALIAQTDMMIMGSAEAEPGDTEVRLPIKLRHVRDIHAYSVALTFPREVVSVRSLDICATEIAATIRPDFNASHIEPSLGHATLGVITEFDGATGERVIEGLEPGQERVIATLVLDVHPDAREGVYPIELTQGLGAAGIVNETSSAGDSVEPDLVHGFLRVGTRNVMHVSSTFGFCGAQPQAILSVRGSNADELNGLSIGITFDWEKAEVLEILAGLDVTREMGFPETERFELALRTPTREVRTEILVDLDDGSVGTFIWYIPYSANLALRELGIILFLACAGLGAGETFFEAALSVRDAEASPPGIRDLSRGPP